jgi:hypothetical protein
MPTATSTSTNTAASANRAASSPQGTSSEGELNPIDDFVEYVRTYAQQRPDLAALWCFGIGFVVGWKLKPW